MQVLGYEVAALNTVQFSTAPPPPRARIVAKCNAKDSTHAGSQCVCMADDNHHL